MMMMMMMLIMMTMTMCFKSCSFVFPIFFFEPFGFGDMVKQPVMVQDMKFLSMLDLKIIASFLGKNWSSQGATVTPKEMAAKMTLRGLWNPCLHDVLDNWTR